MQKKEITIYNHHDTPVFFQGEGGEAVVKSDSTILSPGFLYIGTGGDVKVKTKDGSDLTFSNIPDATFLPIIISMVYSAGTSASDMLILR